VSPTNALLPNKVRRGHDGGIRPAKKEYTSVKSAEWKFRNGFIAQLYSLDEILKIIAIRALKGVKAHVSSYSSANTLSGCQCFLELVAL
jgi:hypothetical protein